MWWIQKKFGKSITNLWEEQQLDFNIHQQITNTCLPITTNTEQTYINSCPPASRQQTNSGHQTETAIYQMNSHPSLEQAGRQQTNKKQTAATNRKQPYTNEQSPHWWTGTTRQMDSHSPTDCNTHQPGFHQIWTRAFQPITRHPDCRNEQATPRRTCSCVWLGLDQSKPPGKK